MRITGENFIGFERSARGNKRFHTFNPELNKANDWEIIEASDEEIEAAVQAAVAAFRSFRSTTDEARASFLEAIAEEIEKVGDELLDVYCAESGLPRGRAEGERGRTVFQLRSFAAFLRSDQWPETRMDAAEPNRTPLPKPDLRLTYIPLGPVVVFGSSNFPLAYSTAGGDTASALAAGCPVIVKSHPMHAGTGELVAGALVAAAKRTGMPDGVFSNLNSQGIEVGVSLVKHPGIKAVGFTGSIAGGRALFDLANARPEPIPVFAEMGSINPVVLSAGALKERGEHWATHYADSIVLGSGQFCTSPGLILAVENEDLNLFAHKLATLLGEKNPTCMLHPNIHAAFEGLKSEVSGQESVKILHQHTTEKPNYGAQTLAEVSGAEFLKNPNLHKEVFGPFSLLVRCKDQSELLAIIERLEGQLTGTILAGDDEFEALAEVVESLQQRVGRIIFNGVPTGVEVCPSMQHGGPYPASTDARFTAVGVYAIRRWIRPVSFQNFPESWLPKALKNG